MLLHALLIFSEKLDDGYHLLVQMEQKNILIGDSSTVPTNMQINGGD